MLQMTSNVTYVCYFLCLERRYRDGRWSIFHHPTHVHLCADSTSSAGWPMHQLATPLEGQRRRHLLSGYR